MLNGAALLLMPRVAQARAAARAHAAAASVYGGVTGQSQLHSLTSLTGRSSRSQEAVSVVAALTVTDAMPSLAASSSVKDMQCAVSDGGGDGQSSRAAVHRLRDSSRIWILRGRSS